MHDKQNSWFQVGGVCSHDAAEHDPCIRRLSVHNCLDTHVGYDQSHDRSGAKTYFQIYLLKTLFSNDVAWCSEYLL